MSCQPINDWVRMIKTEIRQIATHKYIPGTTDQVALGKIQELLLAQPTRAARQKLKDVYCLLIWNMRSGQHRTAWEDFEFPKEMEGRSLEAREMITLSLIEQHLNSMTTSWDRKRSKWTYISIIRDLEAPRMLHQRLSASSSDKTSLTSVTTRSSSGPQPAPIAEDSDEKAELSLANEVERLRISQHEIFQRIIAMQEQMEEIRLSVVAREAEWGAHGAGVAIRGDGHWVRDFGDKGYGGGQGQGEFRFFD